MLIENYSLNKYIELKATTTKVQSNYKQVLEQKRVFVFVQSILKNNNNKNKKSKLNFFGLFCQYEFGARAIIFKFDFKIFAIKFKLKRTYFERKRTKFFNFTFFQIVMAPIASTAMNSSINRDIINGGFHSKFLFQFFLNIYTKFNYLFQKYFDSGFK